VRGFTLSRQAVTRPQLAGRLWAYLTDIPQRLEELDGERRAALHEVIAGSDRLLCQTEELRSYLEAVVPEVGLKSTILTPMIPQVAAVREGPRRRGAPRLFYAGKFAPLWGILETVEQAEVLARRLPGTELHVAGDKVHDPPDDPAYKPAVEETLASSGALVRHGGVSRRRVMELLREADFALSVRHPSMDDSLELSTKVLEYGAAGVPVVLNRNSLHEALYGADYPLFVSTFDEVADVIEAAWRDPERWERARRVCLDVSGRFTFPVVYRRLAPYLEEAAPELPSVTVGARSRPTLVVAGHNLKFFRGIARALERTGAVVRFDHWLRHREHDPEHSRRLLADADTIVCEWMLGNAVWYAEHKQPGQRLVTRFHRMERETVFPSLVEAQAVDTFVFISETIRQQARASYRWPEHKLRLIPNGIDCCLHDRAKLPGAEFRLGMLGYVPALKGLHRALDLLELLRAEDDRFHLSLKGNGPWDLPWAWRRPEERAYFDRQFGRIRASHLLRDAVSIEPFGPVAGWFRKIGVILSLSDYEGSHVSLAEGMAARCLPVIRPWQGMRDLYGDEWVSADLRDAAQRIQQAVCEGTWEPLGQRAREQVCARYDARAVHRAWIDLLLAARPVPSSV
jgi:glycosyltransferase involved in cell wall biosynthesis